MVNSYGELIPVNRLRWNRLKARCAGVSGRVVRHDCLGLRRNQSGADHIQNAVATDLLACGYASCSCRRRRIVNLIQIRRAEIAQTLRGCGHCSALHQSLAQPLCLEVDKEECSVSAAVEMPQCERPRSEEHTSELQSPMYLV